MSFVKPVQDDLFEFQYDFNLEGKAADSPVVTELEDGDLLIEGYAAVWEGDDRQGENFAPGAFEAGLQNFLKGQAALCYHHKKDMCLGKVLDLREEGKGLFMRARVDGSIKDDPRLSSIYRQIKRGTYNGLSTFGYFTRGIGELANKIVKTDLAEISITPVPIHPGTSLAVVAGKALLADVEVPPGPKVSEETELREQDVQQLNFLLEELDSFFRRIEESVQKRSNTNTGTAA
jgi:HK97 family phage prohead protease